MAWHSQRLNIFYSETKIFDEYFEQLFKREHNPENALALNFFFREILKTWGKDNPPGLNETLLAIKAYAPYHHLYAISMWFSIYNNQSEKVLLPIRCYEKPKGFGILDEIIKIAGICLIMAFDEAANEPQPQNRVFSPHNWIKAKSCLAEIHCAIRNYFHMLPLLPGGQEIKNRLEVTLKLNPEDFEFRWAAD